MHLFLEIKVAGT